MVMKFSELSDLYLIGEIGINHNGDMQLAKKMVDAVFACGWNCAKFQKRNPDLCVPEKQKQVQRDTPWGKMSYIDYKYKIEFEKEQYDYLDRYCREKPLDWTVSVWDLDSLSFALNYDLPFIKIPSAHLTNMELLEESSKSGQSIVLSTGMSTLEEIDSAVNILEKNPSDYVLMHCNSSYPSKHEDLNLRAIQLLKERYNCVVGYSGHEYDLEPTVLALSMGATIIERHITIDHNMWGTDQASSLEVHAMDLLRKRLSSIETILGKKEKIITDSEKPIREKLRK